MSQESFTVNLEDNKRLTLSCISLAFTAFSTLMWFGITKWSPPILTWVFFLPFLLFFTIGIILTSVAVFKTVKRMNKTSKFYITLIISLSSVIGCVILLDKILSQIHLATLPLPQASYNTGRKIQVQQKNCYFASVIE